MTAKKISEEVTKRGWHTAQSGNTFFLQDENGLTIESAHSILGLLEKIHELLKNN
tara:strand:- start:91 stop:255 length:165 start_codon:yes stop_codon:yes gene_type:complete